MKMKMSLDDQEGCAPWRRFWYFGRRALSYVAQLGLVGMQLKYSNIPEQ